MALIPEGLFYWPFVGESTPCSVPFVVLEVSLCAHVQAVEWKPLKDNALFLTMPLLATLCLTLTLSCFVGTRRTISGPPRRQIVNGKLHNFLLCRALLELPTSQLGERNKFPKGNALREGPHGNG